MCPQPIDDQPECFCSFVSEALGNTLTNFRVTTSHLRYHLLPSLKSTIPFLSQVYAEVY